MNERASKGSQLQSVGTKSHVCMANNKVSARITLLHSSPARKARELIGCEVILVARGQSIMTLQEMRFGLAGCLPILRPVQIFIA
jgi:hypothetical protein